MKACSVFIKVCSCAEFLVRRPHRLYAQHFPRTLHGVRSNSYLRGRRVFIGACFSCCSK